MAVIVKVTITNTETGEKLEGTRGEQGTWDAFLKNRKGKLIEIFRSEDKEYQKVAVISKLRTVGVFGLAAYEMASTFAERWKA